MCGALFLVDERSGRGLYYGPGPRNRSGKLSNREEVGGGGQKVGVDGGVRIVEATS